MGGAPARVYHRNGKPTNCAERILSPACSTSAANGSWWTPVTGTLASCGSVVGWRALRLSRFEPDATGSVAALRIAAYSAVLVRDALGGRPCSRASLAAISADRERHSSAVSLSQRGITGQEAWQAVCLIPGPERQQQAHRPGK